MAEKRFEYQQTRCMINDSEMNALGAEGWEFVCFSSVRKEMIWKRELPKRVTIVDTNKTPWEERIVF